MISSLTIEGYRCFERFEMSGLGRVNLLVGPNNGGKTSVLEAIYLLENGGNPAALWHVLVRRGECSPVEQGSPPSVRTDAETRHLFRGHELNMGSSFAISSGNRDSRRSLRVAVERRTMPQPAFADVVAAGGMALPGWALDMSGDPVPDVPRVSLGPGGELNEAVKVLRRKEGIAEHSSFIAPGSLRIEELIALWNGVVLTPAESTVLSALQSVEPEIERVGIQAVTAVHFYRALPRGGFVIKLRGLDRPVPIGSLGDAVWSMLVVAIALTQCRGGVLLVDEIDGGLYYSVMAQMWKLIYDAAKELDVQVFATTHNQDCVYSLAPLCASADEQNPITVQRIEPGKSKAVPYSLNQIRIAAEHEIEVR